MNGFTKMERERERMVRNRGRRDRTRGLITYGLVNIGEKTGGISGLK